MKHIQKQEAPPAFLEVWKNRRRKQLAGKSGAIQWEMFKSNNANQQLRAFIAEEQGYICAYCNRRIHPGTPQDDEQARLDHLMPKGYNPNQTLDYYNLVASCFGNERTEKPREVHCEARKGDTRLLEVLFPTDPRCESQFVVTGEGKLIAEDPEVEEAINNTLNLNHLNLIKARKGALAGFADQIPEEEELENLIQQYESRVNNNHLEPFAGIVLNFLRQYR